MFLYGTYYFFASFTFKASHDRPTATSSFHLRQAHRLLILSFFLPPTKNSLPSNWTARINHGDQQLYYHSISTNNARERRASSNRRPECPFRRRPQVAKNPRPISLPVDPFGAQEGTGSRGCRPLERRSLELLRSRLEANGLIEPFKRRRG